MPSRPLVLGIIIFWLATLAWAFQREIWPRFRAGDPPPLVLELEDEVGGRVILWEVYQGDERIGSAQTRITPKPDRTFEMRNDVTFVNMTLGPNIQLKKHSDSYHVTAAGQMLAFAATMKLESSALPLVIELSGEVREGFFHPKLNVKGFPQFPVFLNLQPVDVSEHGIVVSVLHPQNKIHGLYEGRSWKVPVFNSLKAAAAALPNAMGDVKELIALVAVDELLAQGVTVPCWRIDVIDPGKDRISSRTWVRKRDDLVLQLEADHEGKTLLLKRTGVK